MTRLLYYIAKNYSVRALICSLAVLALTCGLSTLANGANQEPIKIFVSIGPQKTFVRAVGKNLVDVSVLAASGQSPHTLEPTPRQMVKLSRAEIFFTAGLDFEKIWIKKLRSTNPNLKIIPMDQGIDKINMVSHHDEKGKDRKDHTGLKDPHIWLDPMLVKIMAINISRALSRQRPADASFFEANLAEFHGRLTRLDTELRQKLKGLRNRRFMVYHPSWGYFARAYNLIQVPIELEGKQPSAKSLYKLITNAKKERIKVVFVQPAFNPKTAKLVARAINGRVVILDPLAADYVSNMKKTANALTGGEK